MTHAANSATGYQPSRAADTEEHQDSDEVPFRYTTSTQTLWSRLDRRQQQNCVRARFVTTLFGIEITIEQRCTTFPAVILMRSHTSAYVYFIYALAEPYIL